MRYEIMSKAEANEATRETDAPNTAIISISDSDDKRNIFYPQNWIKGVLELQFYDVEEGSTGCISIQQADEIANFVLHIKDYAERFLIHCTYGQSRSAGIAVAICVFLEGHDNGIWTNPKYRPNKTCYRYTLNALKKRSGRKIKNVET